MSATKLPHRSTDPQAGFTIIEIVVTIAIAALLFQLATANMGALIPSRAMDGEANKVAAELDFLRSEARLQSKTYKVELDLDRNRYRTILPPEDVYTSNEAPREAFDLGWTDLSERVHFLGVGNAGGAIARSGRFEIAFDAEGVAPDLAIAFVHANDKDMIWTLRLRGLTGQSEILTSYEGHPFYIDAVDEGVF